MSISFKILITNVIHIINISTLKNNRFNKKYDFILQTQRPEIGIMQALESLNDTQVNEFLCGKAPLNLSMRLGDHMMLIQLQLSTVSGAKPTPNSNNNNSNNSSSSSSSINNIPPPTNPPSLLQASRNLQHTLRRLSADVFSGRNRGKFS